MEQVRPFPWSSLPRARRVDARLLAAARGALRPPTVVSACLDALGSLMSCPIEAVVVSLGSDEGTLVVGNSLAIELQIQSGPVPWSLILDVEASLVVAIAARVARRPPPKVVMGGAISPALAGTFAAIVAAAVRRAAGPVLVIDARRATPLVLSEGQSAVNLAVRVDTESSHIRAVFPTSVVSRFADSFSPAQASHLGDLPLDIPIVACRTVASAAEAASVAVGDVWMLESAWHDASQRRAAWLCPANTEVGFRASLEPDGRLVLGHGFEELHWSPMNDPNESPTLVEAIGEVPVVVRVEVGVARMKAREWATLGPGDVIGLGSKIGSKVTLRVSGGAVAEGELVDINGELGVRIRRRLGEK
jgi:type III secretion system YscQ/HrcQ family protein